MKGQTIDIVMTTWNRPELTELSIKTIAKNTLYPSRLIVVDNNSDNPTKIMLRELLEEGFIHHLTEFDTNLGLEPAKTYAMSFVSSPYFVSTDNDILPMKPVNGECWLTKLVDLMDRYPEYKVISCRTQVMIGTGNIFDGHEDEDIVEFPHPGGSLRIMDTELVNKIGGWRLDVDSRGGEERYICGKIHDFGYKTGFATKVDCYHMFGKGNWGYDTNLKPEDHGHNPIWHPAIQNGDDNEELKKYI